MAKASVLYISYDGMLEPLGQSQVIGYLEGLSPEYDISLISYEKPSDWADVATRQSVTKRLELAQIHWCPMTYHKSPPLLSTVYDIVRGIISAVRLARRHNVRIVHARSYISALIGLVVKRLSGARLLFDMRGLWADERADGGAWPREGSLYRAVKRLEKTLLLNADHIVTLTHASRSVIQGFPYMDGKQDGEITVIPTCADLSRFRPDPSSSYTRFVLGYVGSIGPHYQFAALLGIFRIILERLPDAELLVVNRLQQSEIWKQVDEHGIARHAVRVLAANHDDVPALINQMSVGSVMMQPAFCEVARAPTKMAEYLGCGIACIGNVGIGDVASILEDRRVGVVLPDFTETSLRRAVDSLMPLLEDGEIAARCRKAAEELFDISDGVEKYGTIYRKMIQDAS